MTYDNWFPTAELRFVNKSTASSKLLILQQKWRVYPADASITRDEWRNVPMVTEGA